MDDVEGAKTFTAAAAGYDGFMGRYSVGLAAPFADAAGVAAGSTAIDVGCGPGALTGLLVARLGAPAVSACDPTPGFVEACTARFPGVDVRHGRAESLPFADSSFDHALAQLVLHFVSEPEQARDEMARVVRPGGTVSACVWDFSEGMEMLRTFWDSALAVDPTAPDEARTLRFGRPGEIAELFAGRLLEVEECTVETASLYESFDELWAGFEHGVGPAGAYLVALDEERRGRVRTELFARLGEPSGAFTLRALARGAVGRVPG
jgi:SAM-dependent methyltransferase